MRWVVPSLIIAVLLGGGGCDAHARRAPAAAPARAPAARVSHASATPATTTPPAVAASAPPLSVAPSAPLPPVEPAVATCEEPCQGCTVLTDSSGAAAKSRRLSAAEETLLKGVFHDYLLSADCLADPEHVELRDVGRTAHNVSDVKAIVDGSFTGADRKQTLVIFFMGHCGVWEAHSEHYGTSVVVIMEAGKVVMVTERGPTRATELLPIDLENDGVTELVAVSGDYASGSTFSEAEVWSVATGMTPLAHFEMSRQSCIIGEPEYFESALLTLWDPKTKRRCLLQRRRELQCPP
jgi:hypothetical protein